MSIAFISCIFGTQFKNVYPAPLKNHSYFFTNNTEIEQTIRKNGWNYLYVPFPLYENDKYYNKDNLIFCSLQSKFVKFIQFLKDPQFKNLFSSYSYLLYADHKRYIKQTHIEAYLNLYQKTRYPLIISSHEIPNRTLKMEIDESLYQPRYAKSMDATIQLIKEYRISLDTPICNTGIIFYSLTDMNEKMYHMLDLIYQTCISLQQPQCQILWAIFSHSYNSYNHNDIHRIPFRQIVIEWKEPGEMYDSKSPDSFALLLFIIFIISILMLFFIWFHRNK